MKFKSRRQIGKIFIFSAILLSLMSIASGCVGGLTPIGWSGGTVSNGKLFVGSPEGKLVGIDLTSEAKIYSELIKAPSQSGLFGCSPTTGGGCGGGSSGVAIYGSPVVLDDLVYIAGYNGKIYAYNVETLASRWVYPREGYLPSIVGGLVINNGKVFLGISNGKIDGKKVDGALLVLDAKTGDFLHQIEISDKIWSTPAVYGDTLYFGAFDKKLHAIDVNTYEEKWDKPFETGGSIIATPLIYNGVIYIGSFDRNLYAIDADSGKEIWHFTGNNWLWSQPVIDNGIIYAGCLDGFFYMIDSRTGNKISEFKKGDVSSTPVIVDNYVVFATKKPGVLYKIDITSREVSQIVELGAEVDGPIAANDGNVYVHVQGLSLIKVNIESGSKVIISLKSSE